jgi:hypothetical protein
MVVAVKKLLDKIDVLEANFQSEVACLIEVKHRNIVRCLGYSSETQHVRAPYEGRFVWADLRQRLFCFEYLSKGSLADYLTGNIDQSPQTSHLLHIANVLSTTIYTFSWLVSVLRFASFCCASDYICRFSLFLNFSKYLKSRRYLNQFFFIQRVIKLTSSEYPFNKAKKDIVYIESLLTTRFISVKHLPIDKCFPLQLLKRFLKHSSTLFQSTFLSFL